MKEEKERGKREMKERRFTGIAMTKPTHCQATES